MSKRNTEGLIQTFITTDKMHRSLFEKEMNKIGIHRSQHRVLMYLAANQNTSPSQKDIAEHFHISPAAVAVTLKKLESEGYVIKTVLEQDNRVNTVTITEKALTVVSKTMEFSKKLEQHIFETFSDDELTMFSVCLEKMQSAITGYGKRPERKA